MKNIYFEDEEIDLNDLYFMCYMVERVARHLHQRNRYVVNKIGKEFFSGTYSDFKTYPNFGMVYSIFSSSYYNSKNTLISNNNCHYIADYKKFIVSKFLVSKCFYIYR